MYLWIGLNLLVLPGLGSVFARKRISGALQMVAAIVGFGFMFFWFYRFLTMYTRSDGFPEIESLPFRLFFVGLGLFAGAWLWALATSLQILRDTRKTDA